MTPLQSFGLVPHEGPYERWPLESTLVVDGRPSAGRVPGYVVEAQYRTPLGDLLITSWDCPFEESNSFLLLDAAQRVQARAALAVPYGSYLLQAHWPVDALTLVLHYSGPLFYTLSVLPAAGWLRGRPRLRLQRVLAWQRDARMRRSHERLQASLAAIAAGAPSDAARD